MEPRARWQALQTQLTLAQTRLDVGDRSAALAAVDSALALDPNFLAAHALRDRILSTPAPPAPAQPLVSAEGYAQFEQRARRRRVDRRVDAARAAIAQGRVKEAASALDEILELDPNLPDLRELTAAFDTLRSTQSPSHPGRWLAAAAAFAAVVLGASWLQESGAIGSRSFVSVAPPVAPPPPLSLVVSAAERLPEPAPSAVPEATSGELPPVRLAALDREPVVRLIDVVTPAAVAVAETPAAPAPAPPPAAPAPIPDAALVGTLLSAPPLPPAPASPTYAAPPAPPPPSGPSASAMAAVARQPEDEALVNQALQRYRNAYDGLDAQSARAVWPAVNEAALARAFDSLSSQTLTFDACDVTMKGEAAAATCRGSARYVPKVGSHEPRTEPRTWNFTLKKAGAAWTIESARADR